MIFYHEDIFLSIELLISFLSKKRGNKVEITLPKKGKNLNLIKLAEENAKAIINVEIPLPT